MTKSEILAELDSQLAALERIARDQVPGLYDEPAISESADTAFQQTVIELRDMLTSYSSDLKKHADDIHGIFVANRGGMGFGPEPRTVERVAAIVRAARTKIKRDPEPDHIVRAEEGRGRESIY